MTTMTLTASGVRTVLAETRTVLSELSAALAAASARVPPDLPDGLAPLLRSVTRSHDLAWALATFPLFDPAALTRMRKQEFPLRRNSGEGEKIGDVALWVPAFALSGFPPGVDAFDPMNGVSGLYGVEYPEDALKENRALRERVTHERPTEYVSFPNVHAAAPAIPATIARRVGAIAPRFDRVATAWEAQWEGAAVAAKDPLVLGGIGDLWFLLDQFDLTKLERYIASEFTAPPRE